MDDRLTRSAYTRVRSIPKTGEEIEPHGPVRVIKCGGESAGTQRDQERNKRTVRPEARWNPKHYRESELWK